MEPWLLIVLLGACALTAGLLVPRKNGRRTDSGGMESMQAALEQFMENMEAENRKIVDTSLRAAQQQREDNAARDERIAALERRCAELEQLAARTESRVEARIDALQTALSAAGGRQQDGVPADRTEAAAAAAPTGIRARYPELFALYDAGRSVDLIAKKVGMNKGEVMLILQLSKQEEASRA